MERSDLALCVDVLGQLALRVHGRPVHVPGARRRALLALLALEGDRGLSTEGIVDSLWPDEPPEHPGQAVHSHVSRLRGHLGPLAERLARRPGGYRLHLEPFELDVDAARRLAATDPRAALELWRGPALAEFRSLPPLELASVGLDELRLELVDDVLEARLAENDPGVAVDAAAAAAAAPLRERTVLLHVRSLAAAGRAPEAMAVAQAFRHRLAEETGLDPTEAVSELEQQVAAGAVPRPQGVPRIAPPDGPLLGRQHDREEVVRLLGDHAVVTLTGPGGVGKTRLAVDIASGLEEPAAAVVVPLSAVDRPDHVCQAVATAVGLRVSADAGPAQIAAALGARELLLLLDNCEHVAEACRQLVVAIRRQAPRTRVLATSRVTLHVPDEYVVRLQPLPVPRDITDLATLRRQPGVRAFVAHARRRRPDFDLAAEDAADLVEVLRRLDGLPLGIELAARQVAVMPMRAVRERLDRALDLSTGRVGPEGRRQWTLRATIDSSYHLLTGDEQRLLRRMAPFLGGVDLPTVESLAKGMSGDPLDLLHRLVDSSLLVAEPEIGRYHLLYTVRSHLLDELARTGEADQAHERFVERCRAIAEDIAAHMFGPDESATDRRLRAELGNLRAARDLADLDTRVAITVAVDQVVTWRELREVWAWASELAADPGLADHPDRLAVLAGAAEAARLVGDFEVAEGHAAEVIESADPMLHANPLHRAWGVRAVVRHFRGDFSGARHAWLRAAQGTSPDASAYLGSAALAAAYGGDAPMARGLLVEARARATCGSHQSFLAYVEGELLATTRPDEAVQHFVEAIAEAAHVGCTFVEGVARVSLASTRARIGDVAGAADDFAHLLATWRLRGQPTQLWTTARNAAELLAACGSPRTAALLLLRADAEPGAATVDEQIARFSGRRYTPVETVVDVDTLDELREQAERLGAAGVLDLAQAELETLARRQVPAGQH